MRKTLILLFALLVPLWAVAQRVSDVAFEQAGDKVRITYRLDSPADIQVFLSTNGGISYGYPLKAVTGDVGKNVAAGSKTVIWSPLDEMNEITGDHIVFKVVPALRATASTPAGPSVTTDNGGLPGRFSVAPGRQVQFSQGNLQYLASTGTWRFAENQWDMVGMGYGQTNTSNYCYIGGTVPNSDNRKIGSNYSGWIDLFGWWTGNAPTKSSTDNKNYAAFMEWGDNPIRNGGNEPYQWRTLTKDEWVYLFEGRPGAKSKYGAAKVNGMTGVVVLPDSWTLPGGCRFTSGMTGAKKWYDWSYVASTNIYDVSQWQLMESAGAVFLPCAGRRSGATMDSAGTRGYYWSSTAYDTYYAYNLYFNSNYLDWDDSNRYRGRSVRLVRSLSGL